LPPFDFNRHEDTALFFLMIRLKWFMQETQTYPEIKVLKLRYFVVFS